MTTAKNYNITRKATEEAYKNKSGEEKIPYKQVGEMVKFTGDDGGNWYKIKLNHLAEEFVVFENTYGKDKNEEVKKPVQKQEEKSDQEQETEYPEEEINPEDIPF